MDFEEKHLLADMWSKPSSGDELSLYMPPAHQPFSNFNPEQHQLKWEDPLLMDYSMRIEQQFPGFNQQSETPSPFTSNPGPQAKLQVGQDEQMNENQVASEVQDWDPSTVLSNLSFLEQKIHQLKDLVHLLGSRRAQVEIKLDELVIQQQQLVIADLTSIIVQLISAAGRLLPAVKYSLPSLNSSLSQLGKMIISSGTRSNDGNFSQSSGVNVNKVENLAEKIDLPGNCGTEQNYSVLEHESKDEDDADEGENLPPGSYEILQLEKEEILAAHTHFCTICGKGFKRDANLRMHMRGHGDEYKTPAALAKPNKESSSEPMLTKRYSCPYVGCKRNKDHKKFLPLKTILCVKNHYKRTHCDKSYTCSRCHLKKFSVIADLKTHEKHCGKDKWLCSCGTTFSRKDKLFGHIALFQGHSPAIPQDEPKQSSGPSDQVKSNETNTAGCMDFNFNSTLPSGNGFQNCMEVKGDGDDPTSYFSPLSFGTCNLGDFSEFPRPPFDDSEDLF